jgi:hypothetical protein
MADRGPRSSGGGRVKAPIIILGAPRSGTTLLAQLLSTHPDVALANEPRLVWRYGNDRLSDELRAEHASPKVVDRIHASFAAIVREHGAARLVEKTPSNSVRPAFVDAVFPDALFVHITRNGWGAVPSMRTFWARRGQGFDKKQVRKAVRRLREARPSQVAFYLRELLGRVAPSTRRVPLYGPRLAGLQSIAHELGLLEAAAMQWRTCVDRSSSFGRNLGPDRYLELKLEALDAETINRVLDFCGLSPAPIVVERFNELYERGAALRRAFLSSDDRQRIAPYIEPANAWLGYLPEAPPLADRALSPGEAQGRLRVAYIAGTKNCGSTMLDAVLGQATGARSLGEIGGFARALSGVACDCGLPSPSCGPCHAILTGIDQDGELPGLLRLLGRPLKERTIHWTVVGTPSRNRYARLSDRMFSLAAEATNSWLLIDSSKNIARAAALALDGSHDVRVIHLVRDGRGYLTSRRRRAEIDGRRDRPVAALAGWVVKNLAITVLLRPRLGKARYLLCRYEDLVADPKAELRRIGAFLDVNLQGVAERAEDEGVARLHTFEPRRRMDYGLVRIHRERLASQAWSARRNLMSWWCGGFVSALWRYDRAQTYLARPATDAVT